MLCKVTGSLPTTELFAWQVIPRVSDVIGSYVPLNLIGVFWARRNCNNFVAVVQRLPMRSLLHRFCFTSHLPSCTDSKLSENIK